MIRLQTELDKVLLSQGKNPEGADRYDRQTALQIFLGALCSALPVEIWEAVEAENARICKLIRDTQNR